MELRLELSNTPSSKSEIAGFVNSSHAFVLTKTLDKNSMGFVG